MNMLPPPPVKSFEDGSSMLLQNDIYHLPDYTVAHSSQKLSKYLPTVLTFYLG
jgi:hypothetical protein